MQEHMSYPVIDPLETGHTILALRKARGFTVRELQTFMGFENPQAIYKWQRGESLPSLDNLVALSRFLQVPMDDLIVLRPSQAANTAKEPQALPAAPVFLRRILLPQQSQKDSCPFGLWLPHGRTARKHRAAIKAKI